MLLPGYKLMSMVQAAAEGLVWVHGSTEATVCNVARQHEETCGKSKETTFAMISMIADTQLRGKGRGQAWTDWGMRRIRVHDLKVPKNQ